MKHLFTPMAMCLSFFLGAQVDTTDTFDDDDWDSYGDFDVVDEPTRLWADAKIIGMSPQRFFSLGYDYHMGYPMELGRDASNANPEMQPNTTYTQGLRFTSNIPIISRNNFIWQSGLNYSEFGYNIDGIDSEESKSADVANALNDNGLRVGSWVNTFYKPIGEKTFLLLQTQMDMAGDFGWSLQPAEYVRYSGAILWGKRVNDYKQWAVGVSRTYRVGAMNYVPIVMYNWTSRSKKWGAEILAPARMHGRYAINNKNLILFGYELDGASHRLNGVTNAYGANSIELRRGEIKARIDYQFQVTGFFWASIQVGYRINYAFQVDEVDGRHDFTRLFGLGVDQDFWLNNGIGNTPYVHFSLNFVSP